MKKSEQLIGQMREKWAEVIKTRDLVTAESRDYKQEEKDFIEKTLDEVGEIETELAEERKREAMDANIEKYDQLFNGQQPASHPNGAPAPKKGQSLGEQFVASKAYKDLMAKHSRDGRIPDTLRGINSGAVPIDLKMGRKALITGSSDTSAGAFITAEDSGIYEPIGRYTLNLRQLIDVRQTTSDAVEFVRQTLQVTQATPVPEANVTEYSGATGEVSGIKPEGSATWLRVSTPVKTIAVWIPATKRALADASQLRGLIDSELRADVYEELEDQLLNGDGVGENFTGLANTAGVLTQAWNTDILTTSRQAITNLLINGRQVPTAWLLNPQDWETFELEQDTVGRYYFAGPLAQGPRTLWGVPVGQSFFVTQGAGWLGNWRKMVLWDREQATITVSDSHEDFFIRNMVAILCELRAAMGVIRPSAFVEVDLESGS